MFRNLTLFVLSIGLISLTSCDPIDPEVVPIIGVYEAHVQGVSGPFSMNITSDRSDDVFIEAPFDGFEWIVIKADIDNQQDDFKDIDINKQDIGFGATLKGRGFYFQGTIQIDYEIDFGDGKEDFTLVGSRF